MWSDLSLSTGLYALDNLCIVPLTGHILMKKKPVSVPLRLGTRAPKNPPAFAIDGVIHTIRGERVILDADLAAIYGVKTKALNQAVKRNRGKFPPNFLLELNSSEAEQLRRSRSQIVTLEVRSNMRSQFVTASKRNVRHLPFAFTEHGALMAANILNSPQATQMSVFVIRAFVKMRGLPTDTRELAKKLASIETELKSRLDTHEVAITEVLRRIMQLLDPPPGPAVPDKKMGFHTMLTKSSKKCAKPPALNDTGHAADTAAGAATKNINWVRRHHRHRRTKRVPAQGPVE